MGEGDGASTSTERTPLNLVTDETHIQIQSAFVFGGEKHCCGACQRSVHTRGLIFNLFVWGVAAFTVLSYFYLHDYPWSLYVLIGVYVVYMIEVFASATSRYLWNMNFVEDFVSYINRLKTYRPRIWMRCESFHYETRTRTVTEHYTDSSGRQQSRTRTETYTEKVVTSTDAENFDYSSWRDDSGVVTMEITRYNCVRIDFLKEWRCDNFDTTNAYQRQKAAFIRKNEHRDTHFSFWEGMEINDFKEKMMSVTDFKMLSPLIRWWVYVLISMLSFSIFYRLWLERKSIKAKFCFVKSVNIY